MKIKYISLPLWAKILICVIFPVYLVFATELGHLQSFKTLFAFAAANFGIIVFDLLIVGGIYFVMSAIFKKVWISAAICFAVFYAFSCVEYYKFDVSGSHFVISDLALTGNIGDVAVFANITFNPLLLCVAVISLAYIAVLVICNIEISVEKPVRYAASVGIFAVLAVTVLTPYFQVVCDAVGVDAEYTKNTFQENRRFKNNALTANITVNVNQLVNSRPRRPDMYNEEVVDAIISQNGGQMIDGILPEDVNIIVIMSESFADFRTFLSHYPDSGEVIPEGTYDAFDKVASESSSGICVVPTFGGGTARTEIELIFGLPMESQGNPAVPNSLFDKGKEYDSIVSLFADNGYSTTYIHPFSPDFYERVDYYGNFGFDKLIFDEDMSVYRSDEILRLERNEGVEPEGYYHDFISDRSAFEEALERMKYTPEPDYIHITTMQNHMPYGEGLEEEENYYRGLQTSGEALLHFITQLKKFDQPSLVLFVGDHYPYFSTLGNIYGRLMIDEMSCDALYEQQYLIWNNFGLVFPKEQRISTFYLPCILADFAGVSDSFVRAVLSQKDECPVYSPVINTTGTDVLKILAYDRINGKGYAE